MKIYVAPFIILMFAAIYSITFSINVVVDVFRQRLERWLLKKIVRFLIKHYIRKQQ